jgi:Stigma-specific protein, Stig1
MDANGFDRFVASLARSITRRQWLKSFATGIGGALLGPAVARARQDDTVLIQPKPKPLPNFPFLAVAPTDSRYTRYAVDRTLTGPPTRFRTLDAMTELSDGLRSSVTNGFQSAYSATVALPKANEPRSAARGITTVIFDLGNEAAAKLAHATYVSDLFSDPSLSEIRVGDTPAGGFVLGGCRGGCGNLSAPSPSSQPAVNTLAAVGQRGQFLFDVRLNGFNDDLIDDADGDQVAKLIDSRLQGVTALTTPAAASTGGIRARMTQILAPWWSSSSSRSRNAPIDDLRTALGARNSLPIFDLGNGAVPQRAVQTLVVDKGAIVVNFGETAVSAAARQRSVEDVVFACATEQELPVTPAYHDEYKLYLNTIQYVFDNEGDALEFIDETRERLDRDRPRIVLKERTTSADQVSDIFQDGQESQGFRFGCMSHQIIRLGEKAAVLAVEIVARPDSPEAAPIDLTEIERELCPVVGDSSIKFTTCILTPDECDSVLPLDRSSLGEECEAPDALCGTDCVDITSDADHCGECDNACAPGLACVDGACQCEPGFTDCDGECLDLNFDHANCGGCGVPCGASEFCDAGACYCTSGYAPCDNVCCDGGLVCLDGSCLKDCGSGTTACDGFCVDPLYDPANCGDCGIVCDDLCCAGVCTDTSSDGFNCGSCGNACSGDCCGGTCADLLSDPSNCGACGFDCGGYACCNGQCVDIYYDPLNCGGCDTPCSSDCCDGYCVDTFSDSSNCGFCGNVCNAGDECYAGECLPPPG